MPHGRTEKVPILYRDNFASALLELNIQQWQHNILATYQLTRVSCLHFGNTGHPVA